MPLLMLIVAVLTVFCPTEAHARAVSGPTHMIAVEITTDTLPINGYLIVPDFVKIDVTKPDLLNQFVRNYQRTVLFYNELTFVSHPHKMFVSTGSMAGELGLSKVKSIKKTKGQYDGRLYTQTTLLWISQVSRREAELLKTEPYYSCGFVQQYWFSYNKAVGKKELASICGHRGDQTAEELKAVSKYPDVFRVTVDDFLM